MFERFTGRYSAWKGHGSNNWIVPSSLARYASGLRIAYCAINAYMPVFNLCTKYKKKPDFFFLGILRDNFESPCAEGSIDGAIPSWGVMYPQFVVPINENATYMQKFQRRSPHFWRAQLLQMAQFHHEGILDLGLWILFFDFAKPQESIVIFLTIYLEPQTTIYKWLL